MRKFSGHSTTRLSLKIPKGNWDRKASQTLKFRKTRRKGNFTANDLCMLFATLKYMKSLPDHSVNVSEHNSANVDVSSNSPSEQSTSHQDRLEVLAEGNCLLHEREKHVLRKYYDAQGVPRLPEETPCFHQETSPMASTPFVSTWDEFFTRAVLDYKTYQTS